MSNGIYIAYYRVSTARQGVSGLSQRNMVVKLNALGVKSPPGGVWHYTQLRRVLKRLDLGDWRTSVGWRRSN